MENKEWLGLEPLLRTIKSVDFINVLFINVTTILRSLLVQLEKRYEKEFINLLTDNKLNNEIANFIKSFLIELINIFVNSQSLPFKRNIILYYSNYEFIPKNIKKNTKVVRWNNYLDKVFTLEFINNINNPILDYISSLPKIQNILEDVSFLRIPNFVPTFVHLDKLLYKMQNMINRKVYMVTNFYIDLFLRMNNSMLVLIEMFTGKILNEYQIAKKIFNTEYLGLDLDIYLLLGDKYLLKGLLDNKRKKQLIKLAIASGGIYTKTEIDEMFERYKLTTKQDIRSMCDNIKKEMFLFNEEKNNT